MQLSDIELFPVINTQPAGTAYNPANPVQHWQASPPIAGNGKYAYAYLDPATGNVVFASIPVAQANQANIPDGGPQSSIENQNTAINQPPVDLNKYNALAAEGEQIVATPFGLMIEATGAAPAASGTPLAQAQAIQSSVNALVKMLGG